MSVPAKPGAGMPTVERIKGRLRVKIDGRSGSVRATDSRGHHVFYTARRYSVVAMALRWVALGYTDVQVRMGVHARVPFRPFPASRDEAVRAVGELAAQRQPFASQWRRFAARVDRELAAERAAAKELVKSS